MSRSKKNKGVKFGATFLVLAVWLFSGYPPIWHNPPFPPEIQIANAAIAIDGTASTNFNSSTHTSITVSHTVSGENTLLLVFCQGENQTVSSVTFGAQGLANIAGASTAGNGTMVSAWYIAGVSGTQTVTCNLSSQDNSGITAISYTGVDQGTPIGATNSATGGSTTAITSSLATSYANSVIIDAVTGDGGDTYQHAPTSDQVERWDFQSGTSKISDTAYAGGETSTTTTGTYNLNWSQAVSDGYSIGAVEMVPVQDASPAAPTIYDEPEATGSGSTFDNERLQDTTPTFEFSANDPDGSSTIRYKVQWDDDGGFGTLNGNCESGSSCATGNGTYSGSDPYAEDAHVNFTISDTLSESTYYWRVQAQDVTGSGDYGEWSTRSFTVKSGTDPSEWFQAEDEQFDTGTTDDTETTGSNSVQLEAGTSGNNWGDTTGEGTTSAQSTARYMGGMSPNISGMTIREIWAYYSGTGTLRLGIYQGGALDNPVGASLVWDAATVAISGTNWYSISGGSASLDPNAVTWIGFKSTDTDFVYETSWDSGSGFQSALGRWESTSETADPGNAWSSAIPSGGSFNTYWYDLYIVYDIAGATSGTIISPAFDYDWVDAGDNDWEEALWSENETNGTISVRVLGGTDCDTQVVAPTAASPIDLSGLTSTGGGQLHNRLCLEATLTDDGGTPYLNDWTVTWATAGGTLTTDIVDASYVSVSSPTVAMNVATFNFACQTVTGSFGTASQQIYVNNDNGANNGWTLTMAAQATTDVWDSAGTDYDFNDPTSSGCTDGADAGDTVGGQMTIDPSGATLAVGQCGSCTTTNISKGSSTAFNEGTTDAVTLLTATADSDDVGDWTLQGVSISQKIPAEQPIASDYTINMVLTVTAS